MASKASTIGSSFKTSVLNKEAVSKILRNVRESEGFHFYLAIGELTGMNAVSLKEFVDKLDAVEVPSIDFHYACKDFQRWISEVLGDAELTLRLGRIGRVRLGAQGEALRSEILRTVKTRLNELKTVQYAVR